MKTLSCFLLLLIVIVELGLIETRFIDINHTIFLLRQKQKHINKKVSSIVKLFENKLDQNELYKEDIHAVIYLMYQIVLKRKLSIGPDVYWYTRKG